MWEKSAAVRLETLLLAIARMLDATALCVHGEPERPYMRGVVHILRGEAGDNEAETDATRGQLRMCTVTNRDNKLDGLEIF